MEHVNKVAPYLEEKLNQLVEKYDFITTRRGKGLMQGLVLGRKTGRRNRYESYRERSAGDLCGNERTAYGTAACDHRGRYR